MPKYKIADIVFSAEHKYDYVGRVCADYLYNGGEKEQCVLNVSDRDIEKEKSSAKNNFPDAYYESLALYKKLCDYALINADAFFLHCSAVMVDGEAYLFLARSGVGKSTHAGFWKSFLGDRLTYINDDKPMVRLVDGVFYVYGTPWMGKQKLGTNTKAPIKALCFLERDDVNAITIMPPKDAILKFFGQIIRPVKYEDTNKMLELMDKLFSQASLYRLKCNKDIESAKLAFDIMSRGK